MLASLGEALEVTVVYYRQAHVGDRDPIYLHWREQPGRGIWDSLVAGWRIEHIPVTVGYKKAMVAGLFTMGIGALMWHKAAQMAAYGDTSAALKIVLAPYVYVMAVLVFVTAAIHLLLVFVPPQHADAGGTGGAA